METVNFEKTIGALATARANGLPWHAVARILSEAAGELERTAPLGNDFWERAQIPTKLSAVILRRYVRAFRRLEQIAHDSRLELHPLLPQSFTAAELAVRLHERDPSSGLEVLHAFGQPNFPSIEQLRRRLEEAPPAEDGTPRRTVLAGRDTAVERCGAIFAAAASEQFGPGSVSTWRRPLRHFRRLGFEVRLASGEISAGADLYLSDAAARSDVLEELAMSVLLSFYLPSFRIVVGPGGQGTDVVASRASDILDTLDAPWIGILVIDADGSLTPFRAPSGLPPIDRTDAYASLLESLGGRRQRHTET